MSDRVLELVKQRLVQVNSESDRAKIDAFSKEVLVTRFKDVERRLIDELIAGEYAGKIPVVELRRLATFLRSPEGRRFWADYGERINRGEFRDPQFFLNLEGARLKQALSESGYLQFEEFFLSPSGRVLVVDLPRIDAQVWQSIGWVLMADQMNIVKDQWSELRHRGLNPLEFAQ